MNRYLLTIVVAACAVVAIRATAAEPEPIPTDAIKNLVDQLEQLVHEKDKTSAQWGVSHREAVNEFRRKYNGQTLTLNYDIKNVVKGAIPGLVSSGASVKAHICQSGS